MVKHPARPESPEPLLVRNLSFPTRHYNSKTAANTCQAEHEGNKTGQTAILKATIFTKGRIRR
jgi:hypothetical protein